MASENGLGNNASVLFTFDDVEPNFCCPPFIVKTYQSYIDIGTYVQFTAANNSACYGRVYSTSFINGEVTLAINQFFEVEKYNEIVEEELKIPPIWNKYIDVVKLVQTSQLITQTADQIQGIIFVFRTDDIIEGRYACKGILNAFVVRYRCNNYSEIEEIPQYNCLPFPCSYPSCPVAVSFSKSIFDTIYLIRRAITMIMSRNSEKIGRHSIFGRQSHRLQCDSWQYIAAYCHANNITVTGPMTRKRKHLHLRSHLDFVGVEVKSEKYMIRFETTAQFKAFDLLFGKYSQFGINESKPKKRETVHLQQHHHVYWMGPGTEGNSLPVRRREDTGKGIDLIYDKISHMLTIIVR